MIAGSHKYEGAEIVGIVNSKSLCNTVSDTLSESGDEEVIADIVEAVACTSDVLDPPCHSNPTNVAMGLLYQILLACRATTRQIVEMQALGHVYDNINMVFKAAEQTIGQKDSQKNSTCATIFLLYGAHPGDMQTADYLASQDAAQTLAITNIILTSKENVMLHDCLLHMILRIIVAFGGEDFNCFQDDLAACQLVMPDQIPMHTTETFPLPAKNIDESSVTGNVEVIDTIFKKLGYKKNSHKFRNTVKMMNRDQLLVSRFRLLSNNCIGHDSAHWSYTWPFPWSDAYSLWCTIHSLGKYITGSLQSWKLFIP